MYQKIFFLPNNPKGYLNLASYGMSRSADELGLERSESHRRERPRVASAAGAEERPVPVEAWFKYPPYSSQQSTNLSNISSTVHAFFSSFAISFNLEISISFNLNPQKIE